MNDHKLTSLISFLFSEDRKKYSIAPNKIKKILEDLWGKGKKQEIKNEQQNDRRTGEKSAKG